MNTALMVSAELPRIVSELPGPRARAIIARDARVISPSYTRSYPLVAERGYGAMVEDPDGNRFLDFNAGIGVVATGHCHPRVVAAIQRQAANLIHMSGTDFYYQSLPELAEKLAEIAPGEVARRVYFGNSGTEAIEAAMKLARYATGREKFVSFFGGFHGRTMGSLSLTASKSIQKQGFGSLLAGVYHAPYPRISAAESLNFIEDTLFRTVLPPSEVAAFVVEPVQGEGGYIVPPRDFLPGLREIAERHGILLVIDEVQSGMGRTGKWWACDHFGVTPDIMTAAKGIASGMPLSAMIARADLMHWPPGAHASTFGGNPVAAAAALATIALVEEEYMENARRMGERLRAAMRDWTSRFESVADVRGLGLMIGIEMRTAAQRDQVVDLAFEQGLLILGAGRTTVRLSPPLCVSEEQVDWAADTLADCIRRSV